MNPGGDYGKKELSPALRNRFTEIWVPPIDNREDLFQILDSSWKHEALKAYTNHILDFCSWLCERVSEHSLLGLRDILVCQIRSYLWHISDWLLGMGQLLKFSVDWRGRIDVTR